MARDVFISHATEDREVARAICDGLERAGLACWIAPRDLAAGSAYATEIANAVEACRIVLLVFSANADASTAVSKEISIAAETGIPIVPWRLDNQPLTGGLKFHLSGAHWLEAYPGPLDRHIETLVRAITRRLSTPCALGDEASHRGARQQPEPPAQQAATRSRGARLLDFVLRRSSNGRKDQMAQVACAECSWVGAVSKAVKVCPRCNSLAVHTLR